MKKIILLRFHKDIDIVQNRIDLLKYFNKEVKIYGLFGGKANDFRTFENDLTGLEKVTYLDINDPEIKWKFSDLCILNWYRSTGHKLDFDLLYTTEYDLLYLDKLDNIFSIPKNNIALTGLINLKQIKEKWDWIDESPYKEQSQAFLNLMSDKFKLKDFYACLGPGSVLTKDFLERYNNLDLPVISHDELRLPQLATVFGIKITDTGFYDNWNSINPSTEFVFNCNKVEVPIKNVIEQYKSGVRKVFHPVYKMFPLNEL